MKSAMCLRCSRQDGLTLVEVVAAITILGTVLVGVVLSKSRHTHQAALTQRQNVAVRATDGLIANWWASPGGVPVSESGVIEAEIPLTWTTRVVENKAIEDLGALVVRVEVRELSPVNLGPGVEGGPLVVVEMVLPGAEGETEEITHGVGDGSGHSAEIGGQQ